MARGKRQAMVPANESKADKFKRLANMRMNKAIAGIRQLATLGGSNYERPDGAADVVRKRLTTEMDSALANWNSVAGKETASVERVF